MIITEKNNLKRVGNISRVCKCKILSCQSVVNQTQTILFSNKAYKSDFVVPVMYDVDQHVRLWKKNSFYHKSLFLKIEISGKNDILFQWKKCDVRENLTAILYLEKSDCPTGWG